jgi:hypothetical protein
MGEKGVHTGLWGGGVICKQKRYHFEELGEDWRIMLSWILKKETGRA